MRHYERLEQSIGYCFTEPFWLRQALTHRSFGAQNNERLEFIGDSILNYTVARMLYDRFPRLLEGELSRLRANLVNQATLAEISQSLLLGEYLLLGEGELKSGGFNRPSILADALEAIFAAVSFDTDFQQAEQVVRRLFSSRIAIIDPVKQAKDAKTRLQEMLQARRLPLPKYRILEQRGEAHEQWFKVACELPELQLEACGEGSSRRAAEQQAATAVLMPLQQKLKCK